MDGVHHVPSYGLPQPPGAVTAPYNPAYPSLDPQGVSYYQGPSPGVSPAHGYPPPPPQAYQYAHPEGMAPHDPPTEHAQYPRQGAVETTVVLGNDLKGDGFLMTVPSRRVAEVVLETRKFDREHCCTHCLIATCITLVILGVYIFTALFWQSMAYSNLKLNYNFPYIN